MRVAALYDIHGNLPALEAVLAEVDQEDVDAIVCGGDVAAGPFPVEVFDLLTSLPQVRFVRGNADRLVLERDREHGHTWCAERLGDERLTAIGGWPLTLQLDVNGLGSTLFCHAIPRADDPVFTRVTPDADVAELLGDPDVDLLVCGHTHVQFDRRLANGLRVVNAGSVGSPYEGRRGAFWALLGSEVTFRRTEYDVEAATAAIEAVGSPTGSELVRWLLDPPDPDIVSAFFEDERRAHGGVDLDA